MILMVCCLACTDSDAARSAAISNDSSAVVEGDQVGEWNELLLTKDRELSLLILGDNTTKSDGGWVYLVGQWISNRYDRPVTLRTWSADLNVYSPPLLVGHGSGAAVEIWNGGTPARNISYSLDNLSTLVAPLPIPLDFALLSFGHNEGNRTLARDSMSLVSEIEGARAGVKSAVILQNPQRDDVASAGLHRLNMLDLATSARNQKIPSINVQEVFDTGYDLLLDSSGRFPNIDGFIEWANVVTHFIEDN
ncbi:hypothetical protein BJF84_17210 [Rhodococcus sp. CUA-806]|nr:hypothetical protein BJF84_17210 [Rhodococcus sp. CUA-806]